MKDCVISKEALEVAEIIQNKLMKKK